MSNHKAVQSRRHVEITKHAKFRLCERVGNYAGYRDWEDLVKTARYKGKTPTEMTSYEYNWCIENIRDFTCSSHVRILNGFAYIFKGDHGHARTLVTVIQLS